MYSILLKRIEKTQYCTIDFSDIDDCKLFNQIVKNNNYFDLYVASHNKFIAIADSDLLKIASFVHSVIFEFCYAEIKVYLH